MRLWPATACERVRRDASTFLDGRLAAARRATMQQHLQACGECVRELQQLARLSRAMHNLPSFRLADGMASRLRRGLAAAPVARSLPAPSRRWPRVASWAVAAAAAVAVFWLGRVCGRAEGAAAAALASQPSLSLPAPGRERPEVLGRVVQEPVRRAEPGPSLVVEPAPVPNARFADFDHRQRAQPRFAGQGPEAPRPAVPARSEAHELLEQMLRAMFGDEARRDPPRR